MPNPETFKIHPIANLLERYIEKDMIVVDPFARNSKWGTITNDLNKQTNAQYHMEAVLFLDKLIEEKIEVDVVLFDPPYRYLFFSFYHLIFKTVRVKLPNATVVLEKRLRRKIRKMPDYTKNVAID